MKTVNEFLDKFLSDCNDTIFNPIPSTLRKIDVVLECNSILIGCDVTIWLGQLVIVRFRGAEIGVNKVVGWRYHDKN